jgi:hypothetical protein
MWKDVYMQELQRQDKGEREREREREKRKSTIFFFAQPVQLKAKTTAAATITSMFTYAVNKHFAYFHQLATEMPAVSLLAHFTAPWHVVFSFLLVFLKVRSDTDLI